MTDFIEKQNRVVSEIKKSNLAENIVSLVVFGSQVNGTSSIQKNDYDFCLVLRKKRYDDLNLIKDIFNEFFSNLDITIYYENEIMSDLPFRDIGTGCFALNYLSCGEAIIGENIFQKEFKMVSKKLYQRALKEKMFDYVLRLRKAYIICDSKNDQMTFFEKYLARILLDLMIYDKPEDLKKMIKLSSSEIMALAVKNGIIRVDMSKKDSSDGMTTYLSLLDEVTALVFSLK